MDGRGGVMGGGEFVPKSIGGAKSSESQPAGLGHVSQRHQLFLFYVDDDHHLLS